MLAQLRAALVSLARPHAHHGRRLPAARHRDRAGRVPAPGQREPHRARTARPSARSLIGQPFDDPKYFWGRLSATADSNGKPLPYNGAASTRLEPRPDEPGARRRGEGRASTRSRAADPDNTAPIPVDLVTSSGSGLDPHISPAAADYQVHRVAKARGLDEARVRALVAEHTRGPAARHPRRAARQRARAEPRARRASGRGASAREGHCIAQQHRPRVVVVRVEDGAHDELGVADRGGRRDGHRQRHVRAVVPRRRRHRSVTPGIGSSCVGSGLLFAAAPDDDLDVARQRASLKTTTSTVRVAPRATSMYPSES